MRVNFGVLLWVQFWIQSNIPNFILTGKLWGFCEYFGQSVYVEITE